MAVADFAHGIQTSFIETMNARAMAARQAKAKANAADTVQTVSVKPAASTQTAQASTGDSFLGAVLDVVNPLQHLPVVGTVYRAVTGDKIGDAEQVAGDALYGGLLGLGSSIANLIFKDATGKDFGDTVLAFAEDATGIHLGGNTPTAIADAGVPGSGGQSAKPQQVAALDVAALTPAKDLQVAASPTAVPASAQLAARETPAKITPAQATMLADPSGFMAALRAKGIDPALALRAMSAYEKSLGIGTAAKDATHP